jgi:DNA topoisomerase-1
MNLFIVESPTKSKNISKYLKELYPSENYVVKATAGHFKNLIKDEIGLEKDSNGNIKGKWLIDDGKHKLVKELKDLSNKSSIVYIATDPDREGEKIASDLVDELNPSSYKRVYLNSITKQEIKKEIENTKPKEVDYALKESARIRRLLDRKIGYPLSTVLRAKVEGTKGIGRVSAPVLELIAQREDEISGHKPKEYKQFKLRLKHQNSGKEFDLTLKEKFFEERKKLFEAYSEDLESIKRGKQNFQIRKLQGDKTYTSSPKLFTTTTVQKEISSKLKIKPHDTMKILQKLFEDGYITYHRTDSFRIDRDKQIELLHYLEESRNFDENDILFELKPAPKTKGQDGHEAIRPTSFKDDFEPMKLKFNNENEKNIYTIIWERTLAYQLKDKVEYKQNITISAMDIVEEFNIKTLLEDGWTKYIKENDEDKIDLNDLEEGQEFTLLEYEIKTATTKASSRYTIPTLLSKLESLMIGRPSTIATILKEIEEKGYIEEQNGLLVLTVNGREIISFLRASVNWLVNIEASKELENQLDLIKDNKLSANEVYNEFEDLVDNILSKFQSDINNYKSKNKPTQKMIQFAKKLNNNEPLPTEVEENFETCKQFIDEKSKENNKPTPKMLQFASNLNNDEPLPIEVQNSFETCKDFISKKSKEQEESNKQKQNDRLKDTKETKIKCFLCKENKIVKNETHYSCTKDNCFHISKKKFETLATNLKINMSETIIEELLSNGTTLNAVMMSGKKGKPFEANIILSKDKKYGWKLDIDFMSK